MKNNFDFKLLNAYDNDIIEQLKDCEAYLDASLTMLKKHLNIYDK